jgi:hypothetical protein
MTGRAPTRSRRPSPRRAEAVRLLAAGAGTCASREGGFSRPASRRGRSTGRRLSWGSGRGPREAARVRSQPPGRCRRAPACAPLADRGDPGAGALPDRDGGPAHCPSDDRRGGPERDRPQQPDKGRSGSRPRVRRSPGRRTGGWDSGRSRSRIKTLMLAGPCYSSAGRRGSPILATAPQRTITSR